MKTLITFLLILIVSIPCLAQEPPAIGKPTVYGFTIDVTLQQAKETCLKYKDATWVKKPNEIEKNLGDFYQCSSNTKNGKYFFHANIFIKNGKVAYIRFLINQGNLCNKIEKTIKDTPLCEPDDIYWHYCDDLWKINCYKAQEGKVKINIVDILTTMDYVYENYI